MKRKFAHLFGGAFVMMLLTVVLSVSASAEAKENVPYLDENEAEQTVTATVVETVTSDAAETEVTWTTGWYVVPQQGEPDVYIHGRIRVKGDVHLILCDNATLSAYSGINVPEGSSLTIYAQSTDEGTMGILDGMQEVDANKGRAFIGGDSGESSGTVTINGGKISVGSPSGGGAGIGGGSNGSGGTLTINGGTINGFVSNGAAIIGGGVNGAGGQIKVATKAVAEAAQNTFSGSIGSGTNGGECSITFDASSQEQYSFIPEFNAPGNSTIVLESFNARGLNESFDECEVVILNSQIDFENDSMPSFYVNNTVRIENSTISGSDSVPALNGEASYHIVNSTVPYMEGVSGGNSVIELENSSSGTLANFQQITINKSTVTGNAYTYATGVDKSITILGPKSLVTGNVDAGSVKVDDGTIQGDLSASRVTFIGGNISGNVEISQHGEIKGGVFNLITANICTDLNIENCIVQQIQLNRYCDLSINGGSISNLVAFDSSVVYDYTSGSALPTDFEPLNMLYLCYDEQDKTLKGLLGGNVSLDQDFTVLAPLEWGNQTQMEITILPGATATVNRFHFTGTLLVQGTLQASPEIGNNPMVVGTTPYYAINSDEATVFSVSANGGIQRDGVTYAQPDALVTLTPKESSAVRWAADPSYLTIQNNKFYMPAEVVSVKSSKLPLEETPALGIDSKGENLTGLTVGAYYSISDAIFRPSKTTLPIRPEWYGTTVTIIKLGDGFATGDSFAQSLTIPAKSSGSGTVAPAPTPGGDDSDWEQAEEEITDAKPGATVTVEDTDIPREALETLAGKNVTLRIEINSSLAWEIQGEDLKSSASYSDLDLGVTWKSQGIPSALLKPLLGKETVQFSVNHDGDFGFPATLVTDLGRVNAGRWANLYHYDEKSGAMKFETAVQIGTDGKARLPMTHASQYAIVIHEKSHQLPFADVPDAWYAEAVRYVYTHEVMEGTGGSTFAPAKSLTRAEVVQILYNLEGKPAMTGTTSFEDSVSHWAKTPIAWAQQTGVVDGYEDNTFRPEKAVTRDELAQMLYNYAQYKGYDLTNAGDLTQFPDGDQVSDWAETAMSWANGKKLINGFEDDTLRPGGNSTRAQAASILMKFDQNLVQN